MYFSPASFCFRSCRCAALLGLLTFLTMGCSKGTKDSGENGLITGTVIMADGKPLPRGRVTFSPAEGELANSVSFQGYSALVDENGKYSLPPPGLQPGPYLIAVEGPTRSSDSKDKTVPVTINGKYKDKKTSNLKYTVVAGPQEHKIELPN